MNNGGTGSGDKIINGTAKINIDQATGTHPIYIESSQDCLVDNNHVIAANGFGISASSSSVTSQHGIKITNNRIIGNRLEAITIGGYVNDFDVSGNTCTWTAGQDFGMSFVALGVSGQRMNIGRISNNLLDGCGASAITLIGDIANVSIDSNVLMNFAAPTRAAYVSADSSTGIALTGQWGYAPTNIRVSNNYLRSATGFENHTVGEFNAGGVPNGNIFSNNDGSYGIVSFYKVLGSTTTASPSIYNGAWVDTTPAVGNSGGGVFTSASAALSYLIEGKKMSIELLVSVFTAGSASGFVQITLPGVTTVTGGVFTGTNTATGKSLSCYLDASSSTLKIAGYDGVSVIANGQFLVVSGVIHIA